MLTQTSGIRYLSGYQAQLDVSNSDRSSNRESLPSSKTKETNDRVDISSKAKEIQNEYQRKNAELEQRHKSETQQLEKEYRKEKNKLENEFNLKKQRLEINVFV